MADRFTKGFIAGVTGGVVANTWSFFLAILVLHRYDLLIGLLLRFMDIFHHSPQAKF